jgi:predicted DNA-binding antitoxin AbrB/MazE fold protein
MQIEVIWENGVLRPKKPLALRRSEVTIEVPDEEIQVSSPTEPEKEALETEKFEKHNLHPETIAALESLEDIKQSMLAIPDDKFPELTEEQEERIRAFTGREDR